MHAAHELGAIQTLLITDTLFRVNDVMARRKYSTLVEEVESGGGAVFVFSGATASVYCTRLHLHVKYIPGGRCDPLIHGRVQNTGWACLNLLNARQTTPEVCITSLQACMQQASSWISSQAWRPFCASRCQTLKTQNSSQMAREWKRLLLDSLLLERVVLSRCIVVLVRA